MYSLRYHSADNAQWSASIGVTCFVAGHELWPQMLMRSCGTAVSITWP